jgi:enterochelin esterase-like enzyme
MLSQYIPNLRKLRAIGMDVGDKDGLAQSNRQLSETLSAFDIRNMFETYDGDHTNRIAERVRTKVLPFFSANLSH